MATRQTTFGEHLRRLAQATDSEATDGQLLEQFHSTRNEAAFASLVRRHGPMVWSVCRRMLLNEADAEDAFQATFLVLVRKSGSVIPRERVGNWLYGVACLTARKTRSVACRRNATERQVETMPQPAATDRESSLESAERQTILYEELEQLPDRFRAAIVLCDLQGVSRREAAQRLAIGEGTLSSRLARGRSKLAQHLKKRNIVLTSGAIALALPTLGTTAAPALVQNATVRTGLCYSLGKSTDSSVSGRIVELSEGVLKTMWLKKLKLLVLIALLVSATLFGAGISLFQASAQTKNRKDTMPDKPNNAVVGQPKVNDQDRIQGTWRLVSASENGNEIGKEEFSGSTLVITKAKLIFNVFNDGKFQEKKEWTYKLDPGKTPRHLNITSRMGAAKAIYKIEGNTLKIVMDEDGNRGRPTAFQSVPNSANDLYMTFERVPKKNPKAMPPKAVDLSKIDRSIAKEPVYRSAYQEYCLLAINAEGNALIWVVRDGADMYVDLNGNGDLTEDGEKFVGVYNADAKGSRKLNLYIYPSKKVFGTTIRQIQVYSPFGRIGWHLEAQFNVAKHSEYSTRPIQPSRSTRHAPVVHLNGPISVVPHLAHELESELRLMTSIKYTRGQAYPLMLLVGNMGVGRGAQVHCESRELEKRLKNTVVEGRLRYTDKNGKTKVTTLHFHFRERG